MVIMMYIVFKLELLDLIEVVIRWCVLGTHFKSSLVFTDTILLLAHFHGIKCYTLANITTVRVHMFFIFIINWTDLHRGHLLENSIL